MSETKSTTCEQCGRFEAVMEDPTFEAREGGAQKPLQVCELCAKGNIESEMMRLGQAIN